MTTIVYRDRVLAGDTAVMDRGCHCGTATKIFRAPDGSLGGVAGCMGDSAAFRDWFVAGAYGDPPEFKDDDSEGILISPDGDVEWIGEKRKRFRLSAPYYAIGSGFRVAMGALAAGADAMRAVEIACDLDSMTQRPLVFMTLQPPGVNGASEPTKEDA